MLNRLLELLDLNYGEKKILLCKLGLVNVYLMYVAVACLLCAREKVL